MIHQSLEPFVASSAPRPLPDVPYYGITPEGAAVGAGAGLAALSLGAHVLSAVARGHEWNRTAGTLNIAARIARVVSPVLASTGVAVRFMKTHNVQARGENVGSGRWVPIDEIEPNYS